MKIFFLICCALMIFSFEGHPQDPHFSQFFVSPLTLNPALTGKFNGDIRAAGNYRNQYPSYNNAYTTYTLSVDGTFIKGSSAQQDNWGAGILALKDISGNGILTNSYLGLSTSYHKSLDENGWKQISIGIQAILGEKRFDNSKLFFEDQLTSQGFTGITQDIFSNENLNIRYTDIAAGILYTASTDETNNFYLGASMYHINKPRESFKGGNWNLGQRTTISAGGYLPLSATLTLHTSGIYQLQNKASEIVAGGALSATVSPVASTPIVVYAGAWYRLKDALIPYIGLEYSAFRIGASYDINTSGLKAGSQSKGGMEFSMIYIKPQVKYKGIPCFKF